jgi:hypothetical protein
MGTNLSYNYIAASRFGFPSLSDTDEDTREEGEAAKSAETEEMLVFVTLYCR